MTKKQAMPYLKLYSFYLDDVDFIELDRVIRSLYWDFNMLAWTADANGDLINRESGKPLTIKNIAVRLREDISVISGALDALVAAGMMHRNGEAWNITRFREEQINQAEYRAKEAERKANQRKKSKESRLDDSEDNEMDQEEIESKSNQEEESQSLVYPSSLIDQKSLIDHSSLIDQSSLIQEKSPSPVAQDSSGTTGLQASDLGDGIPPLLPDTIDLVKYWRSGLDENISPRVQMMINRALYQGITYDDIWGKINFIVKAEDVTDREAYLVTCLKQLYRDNHIRWDYKI